MYFDDLEGCTFFYLKFIQAMLCQKNTEQFLEEAKELGIHTSSLALLKMLRDLVNAYTQTTSLPAEVRGNILHFVNVNRFINQEGDRTERFAVCNEIIENLNLSYDKKEYPFYPSLINLFLLNPIKRIWGHVCLLGEPEETKQKLAAFASLEFYVLYSHSKLMDDDDFLDIGCSLLLSDTYLECIRVLLAEMPSLGEDIMFRNRVCQILESNEHLLDEYHGQPNDTCVYELDPQDTSMITNKAFWKLHNKVKVKMMSYQKDS